jgi:ribonuclease J
MKDHPQLIKDTCLQVRNIIEKQISKTRGSEPNWTNLKANLRDGVGEYLFQKTERRPMILPVIVEV